MYTKLPICPKKSNEDRHDCLASVFSVPVNVSYFIYGTVYHWYRQLGKNWTYSLLCRPRNAMYISEHKGWQAFGIFGIIIYILGMPLVAYMLLRKFRTVGRTSNPNVVWFPIRWIQKGEVCPRTLGCFKESVGHYDQHFL